MKEIRLAALREPHITKMGIATVAGLLSGYLILLIIASLLFKLVGISQFSSVFKLSIFLLGWAVSAFVLFRAANSVADIIAKSCLLGAVEWLLVTLVTLLLFNYCPPVPVAMTASCLIGFVIAWRGRSGKPPKPH